MSKKVYCKNCIYYNYNSNWFSLLHFDQLIYQCLRTPIKRDVITGAQYYKVEDPRVVNKNYNCKDFNPKLWYKIKQLFLNY